MAIIIKFNYFSQRKQENFHFLRFVEILKVFVVKSVVFRGKKVRNCIFLSVLTLPQWNFYVFFARWTIVIYMTRDKKLKSPVFVCWSEAKPRITLRWSFGDMSIGDFLKKRRLFTVCSGSRRFFRMSSFLQDIATSSHSFIRKSPLLNIL